MAFGGGGADKRAAGWTHARARVFGIAFEKPGDRFASAINFPLPTQRKRQTVSFTARISCELSECAPIILEIENYRPKRNWEGFAVKDFEEFGRWLDEEVQRVRKVIETDVKPTAEQKCISALKIASEKLSQMAEELEKRAKRKSA